MKAVRVVALSLVAAGLTGCVTSPYKPPEGAQTATLIGARGQAAVAFGGSQLYMAFTDDACKEKLGTLALFNMLGSAQTFEAKLVAQQKVYIRAVTAGGRPPMTVYCTNVISLVPEVGATYSITQVLTGNQCFVELVDTKTNAAPASLQSYNPPASSCTVGGPAF